MPIRRASHLTAGSSHLIPMRPPGLDEVQRRATPSARVTTGVKARRPDRAREAPSTERGWPYEAPLAEAGQAALIREPIAHPRVYIAFTGYTTFSPPGSPRRASLCAQAASYASSTTSQVSARNRQSTMLAAWQNRTLAASAAASPWLAATTACRCRARWSRPRPSGTIL